MLIAFVESCCNIVAQKNTCNESYKLDLKEESGLQIGFCLQKNPTMVACYRRIQPVTNLLREGVHGFFCYIGK